MTELPLPRAVTSATLHHLEQLIDGSSFGSILLDPAGTILWSNAAAPTMHGVEKTADLGANADGALMPRRLPCRRSG
ncbi:PAS domain-containing protein [Sphingomonas profundi]|uniref:PAS domain-containing protein n=1 Tax=Alterirhizorhabdus profundi TaxID=2681549 RepID=UPI0018D192AD|nr:PAS domain-containing protein [Sphingomonas profundi]